MAALTLPDFPRTLTTSNDMQPLETYLEELRAIRSSGAVVKETSGYRALANLFDAIGHILKPKVRCFIHVKNSGAGLPDGGLFTTDQLKNTDEEPHRISFLPAAPVSRPNDSCLTGLSLSFWA